jgi:peptide deformylase
MVQLTYYDSSILRQKAKPIDEINDSIRELAKEMIQVMDQYNGIGLAAPQVGCSVRLFIARLSEKEDFNEWIQEPVDVFINPVLSNPSLELCEDIEGCLSIPGLRMKVLRPKSIHIKALDLQGRPIEKMYTGFLARVLMHENDHLNGVLYIDRLSKKQKTSIQQELQKIKKHYQG